MEGMHSSLVPILRWLQVLGMNLIDRPSASYSYRFLSSIYGLVCFLLHLASQFYMLNMLRNREFYEAVHTMEEIFYDTVSWNMFIDYINVAVCSLGSHLILLFVVRPRWSRLLEAIEDCASQLDSQFFTTLRKICLFGPSYVITMVINQHIDDVFANIFCSYSKV